MTYFNVVGGNNIVAITCVN